MLHIKNGKMMFNRAKLEIDRIPASRMLKLEVPELALEVIGSVKKHDPELLGIAPMFDLLVAKMPAIRKLEVPYGLDPMVLTLKPLRGKLMLHASAIKLRLKMLKKDHDEKDLVAIEAAINRHLLYLNRSRNDKVCNQKVTQFIEEVEVNEGLFEAMTEFGFMELVGELELALKDVRKVINKRTKSLSERPEKTTKELIDIVIGALNDVFKEIEVAQLRNPDLDYGPLARELNTLMTKYRLSINLRKASNRRKTAEKKVGEMVDEMNGEMDEGELTNEPTTSTLVQVMGVDSNGSDKLLSTQIAPISIDGLTNELDSESDLEESRKQKKAVAIDGNRAQQLIKDDEAKCD